MVVASIAAIHDLNENARRRMDASRLVAGVVSTADELLFVEWQGIAGSVAEAPLKGQIAALLSQIDVDLKSL